MSMKINGSCSPYKASYAERVQSRQGLVKEAQKQKEESFNKKPILQDEYISSDKSEVKPIGLYRLEQDKKCITNTDKVDREIEKLKEKKQQLEQQIQSISGNEKKVRELEKKLAQIESELNRKDNDTYRRQNAEVS